METAHWVFIAGVATFVVTLAAGPLVLLAMPSDYFCERNDGQGQRRRLTPARVAWLTIKNLFGLCLIAAGLVMLVTPGQGVISILVGLWMMDLPGKRRLERRIVGQPRVLQAINKLRARFGRPPLEFPC